MRAGPGGKFMYGRSSKHTVAPCKNNIDIILVRNGYTVVRM